MANFTGRMVHPNGPHPFPADPREDRDTSQDPRSVMTIAGDADAAREVLERDNPGFVFVVGPEELAAE